MFEDLLQRYNRKGRSCKGDALGSFQYCGKVTCNVPIGAAHFGIRLESHVHEVSAAMSFEVVPVITGSEDD
jgi:hypothetical protein